MIVPMVPYQKTNMVKNSLQNLKPEPITCPNPSPLTSNSKDAAKRGNGMLFLRQALWFVVSPSLSWRKEGSSLTQCSLAAKSVNPRPPPPPDITPLDDDDDDVVLRPKSPPKPVNKAPPSSPIQHQPFSSSTDFGRPQRRPSRPRRPAARPSSPQSSSSWMDRNAHYAAASSSTSFRDDFRGTRVFLQGIPPGTSWQTLKDHCRTVLDRPVVYASISNSNNSHGIVQFETTDAAQYAIQALRNFPLEGQALYARADVQQGGGGAQKQSPQRSSNRSSNWHCANPEEAPPHADDAASKQQRLERIYTILQTRDAARRRHNFPAADAMRQQLRQEHGVQLDDRLQLWWWCEEQPSLNLPEWRHIPTEQDTAVDPAAIRSLLEQRDRARQRKDFTLADDLLEQVVTAPEPEGLTVRVHDQSRTWRLWVEARPRKPYSGHHQRTNSQQDDNDDDREASARNKCLELVHENDPSHLRDVLRLLEQFPASSILPRLRQRYSSSSP